MDKINLLRNFGIKNEEEVVLPGINAKLNEIQAAIGLMVLGKLEEEKEKRRKLFEVYNVELGGIEGLSIFASDQSCIVRIASEDFGASRDDLYEYLKEFNVFGRKYFSPLCSNYPHYKELPSAAVEKLPFANKVAKEVLSLPFYGELGPENARKISNIIKNCQVAKKRSII